jgi:hypothetical protein
MAAIRGLQTYESGDSTTHSAETKTLEALWWKVMEGMVIIVI